MEKLNLKLVQGTIKVLEYEIDKLESELQSKKWQLENLNKYLKEMEET